MKELPKIESLFSIGTAVIGAGLAWGVAYATVSTKVEHLQKEIEYNTMQRDDIVKQISLINERTIRIETMLLSDQKSRK